MLLSTLANASLQLKADTDAPYPSFVFGYVNCPSWTLYLSEHPGYKNYKPPKNIRKEGAKWGTWITFPQKIEAIQIRVGDIQRPIELFASMDFLAMYKHPDYYLQPVLDYLVNENYSLAQKEIALYAIAQKDILSLETYYHLYKDGKINLELLESAFAIGLVNHNRFNCNKVSQTLCSEQRDFFQKVIQNVPDDASISIQLKALLSGTLPKSWHSKILLDSFSSGYYKRNFPFLEVMQHAERERKASETMKFTDIFHGLEAPPYFLMVLEHPLSYYFGYFNDCPDVQNGTRVLRDPIFSKEEKSMAIWGISQLCVASPNEAPIYASFIESTCEWYQQGQLSLEHLHQLFQCNFKSFYKYPFSILEYKNKSIQAALERFIAMPTIPCALKEVARKFKNGTLATKEEMAYMEGYRQFRKTHFTLYETVPPCGN